MTSIHPVFGAIIDLGALWKIVVASFIAGVGAVAAISLVIAGLTAYETGRERGESTIKQSGPLAVVGFGGALLLALLVVGFWAMTKK